MGATATRQILELASRLTQPGAVGAGMEQRQVVLGREPRGQSDRTTGGRAGIDQVGEALSRATGRPSLGRQRGRQTGAEPLRLPGRQGGLAHLTRICSAWGGALEAVGASGPSVTARWLLERGERLRASRCSQRWCQWDLLVDRTWGVRERRVGAAPGVSAWAA